ncbi:TPA: AAA family ATPase [Burkholderia orbicola]|nr:ATP-binding protein [Burkholderia cenocepacia]
MTQHIPDGKTFGLGAIAEIATLNRCDIAMERAVTRSPTLPGLVGLVGPSGRGKSMAANYVASSRRACYVQANSSVTKASFLRATLRELEVEPASNGSAVMTDQVGEALRDSGRPLIVDEADYLFDRNVADVIRDVYESSLVPILIVGKEGLRGKIAKDEQMHGRVLDWVDADPITLDDARKLCALYCANVTVGDDLLAKLVKLSHGSVRRVAVNLERIKEVADVQDMQVVDLAAWGKRQLYTCDVPKRRVWS